jgi:hypothetical protein
MEPLKKPRITETEQGLLKSVFENREDLLLLIRDLFFGFELTADERATIKAIFSSAPLRRLMRRIFIPELERGVPITESIDLWMILALDEHDERLNKLPIEIHAKVIEMFETALALLENPNGKVVNLKEQPKTLVLLSRVKYVKTIEARLQDIWLMAHKKEETGDERAVRLAKDSLK